MKEMSRGVMSPELSQGLFVHLLHYINLMTFPSGETELQEHIANKRWNQFLNQSVCL